MGERGWSPVGPKRSRAGFEWQLTPSDSPLLARLLSLSWTLSAGFLGVLVATLDTRQLKPGELDQNKIPKTEFRPETTPLGMSEKLAIRGLIMKAGLSARNGEEVQASNAFLQHLVELARQAGGPPPLPEPPDTAHIHRLLNHAGNERLSAMLAARQQLEANFDDWSAIAQKAQKRLPGWQRLEQLLGRCQGLDEAAEVAEEMAAIRQTRALLQGEDPVPALESRLCTALRAQLKKRHDEMEAAHKQAMATLQTDHGWQTLGEPEQQAILGQVALIPPKVPALQSTDELLAELNQRSLDARADAVSAVPERVSRALEAAARANTPAARRVNLRPATLSSEQDVRDWLAEQEKKLLEAVGQGPVIIG